MIRLRQSHSFIDFCVIVASSIEYRRRKEWYDHEVSKLAKKEFLIAYLVHPEVGPIYMNIDSFADFCDLLDAAQCEGYSGLDIEFCRSSQRLKGNF